MKIFRKYAPVLITLFLVVNILLVGLIVSSKRVADKNTSPDLSLVTTTVPSPTISASPTSERTAVNLGNRVAGSIEDIDLIAQPLSANDSVAMIKLYIENGEVLDFTSTGFIALGSCIDNKTFTFERVCVDIAKTGPFTSGEKLGTVKIKWGNNGVIYHEAGNGYYNGQETSKL